MTICARTKPLLSAIPASGFSTTFHLRNQSPNSRSPTLPSTPKHRRSEDAFHNRGHRVHEGSSCIPPPEKVFLYTVLCLCERLKFPESRLNRTQLSHR